jgi:hypothetical protein
VVHMNFGASIRDDRIYIVWDNSLSAGRTTKRQHICPLEEYVRRLTGEIVVKISVYLSRAERSCWRDRVTSVGADDE